MRKCRKMISLIMLMVMLVSLLPSGALAAEAPTGGTTETTAVEEPQGDMDVEAVEEPGNEDSQDPSDASGGEAAVPEDPSEGASVSDVSQEPGEITEDIQEEAGGAATTSEVAAEVEPSDDAGLGLTSVEVAPVEEPVEQEAKEAVAQGDLFDYISANNGSKSESLYDKNGAKVERSSDGKYHVKEELNLYRYEISVWDVSFLPGTYTFDLPAEFDCSLETEAIKLRGGKKVGSASIKGNKLNITLDDIINNYQNDTIIISFKVEVSGKNNTTGKVGTLILHVDGPSTTSYSVTKSGSVSDYDTDEGGFTTAILKWTSKVSCGEEKSLVGKTIKDSITTTSTHSITAANKNKGVTVEAVNGSQRATWTLKAGSADFSWDGSTGWTYKIPSKVPSNASRGAGTTLGEGWSYTFTYYSTSIPDKKSNGTIVWDYIPVKNPKKINCTNSITADGKAASATVSLGRPLPDIPDGTVTKKGSWLGDNQQFEAVHWTITSTLYAKAQWKPENEFYLSDYFTLGSSGSGTSTALPREVTPDWENISATIKFAKTGVTENVPVRDSQDTGAISASPSGFYLVVYQDSDTSSDKTIGSGDKAPYSYFYLYNTKEGAVSGVDSATMGDTTLTINYEMEYTDDIIEYLNENNKHDLNPNPKENERDNHIVNNTRYAMNNYANGFRDNVNFDQGIGSVTGGENYKRVNSFPSSTNDYTVQYRIKWMPTKNMVENCEDGYFYLYDDLSIQNVRPEGVVAKQVLVPNSLFVYPVFTNGDDTSGGPLLEGCSIISDGDRLTIKIKNIGLYYYSIFYSVKIVADKRVDSLVYSNSVSVDIAGDVQDIDKVASATGVISPYAYMYKITVNKVDDKNTALKDAKIGVYYENGTLFKQKVTDTNGKADFSTNVTEGIIWTQNTPYYILEDEAPTGYAKDETKHWFVISDKSFAGHSEKEYWDEYFGGADKYTFVEAGTSASADDPDAAAEFTIVNTPESISIPVEKVWKGASTESVTIRLLANGEPTDMSLVLNESNNWEGTFTDLPKNDDSGNKIEYTISEDAIAGYKSEISGTTEGFTVTNTELTEATVKKVWNDNNDQDHKRPTELKVTLSNGTEVTLNEANNWTAKVENLPKYDNGVEIEYSWTEDEAGLPKGYELTDTSKDGTITTLTNSYTPDTTSATVKKVWDDKDNQDGKRPTSLKVTLSNGAEVTLNEANKWTATVNDLPKYDNGKEIVYTWTEDKLPNGYTLSNTSKNGTITTLTNSYTPEVTEATVKKVWDDKDNQDDKRPGNLKVTLSNGTVVILSEANNWTAKVEKLPKYDKGKEIVYTWTEETLPNGYTLSDTSVNGTVTTLTNSYTPDTTSATVKKVWDDKDNQDGKRPTSLKVTLSNGAEVTLNEANKWTATVNDLPKYDNGKEIVYTWTEDKLPNGYTLSDTSKNGTITTLTNSYTPEETEATVKKVWDDNNNQDGKRPTSLKVTLSNGTEVTLNEANNWTAKVEKLPKYDNGKEIVYTWTEDKLPNGYTLSDTSKDGTVTTLTNSYTPEVTEATVKKVWNDKNNQDGKRPTSLKVTLSNGAEVTLNEANNWTAKVEKLPKYDNGKEIVYTWTEAALPEGYSLTATDKNGTITTLTNTYDTEVRSISVTKVWKDDNDMDRKQPDSIEVQLYADEEAYGDPVTIKESDGWKYTWTGLDKFKDGKEITYTVDEVEAPKGYEKVSIDGGMTTGYIITNKHDERPVSISKVDITNGEEVAGAYLQVLDKDGQVVDKWESEANGTPHVIYGLTPGVEYTLRETIEPDGYTIAADTTFTIIVNEEGEFQKVESSGTVTENNVVLVKDAPTKVNVRKVDIANDKELPGATLQIIDSKGVVFKEWTSTEEDYVVTNLIAGEEYTLVETVAPLGFTVTSKTTFTVDNMNKVTSTGTVSTTEDGTPVLVVEDTMTVVKISKTDITGDEELKGATLQILDESGNVVTVKDHDGNDVKCEWVSTDKPHVVEGLEIDKTYTLREKTAPDGFIITADATFSIDKDNRITTEIPKNSAGVLLVKDEPTKVKVSKVDITGEKELQGATLQILDSEGKVVEIKDNDGNVVETCEWVSTKEPKDIVGLKTGVVYTLHETVAPDGYTIANDFQFTIATDGKVTCTGKTTTAEDGTTVLLVEDEPTKVYISKVDITNEEELPGATLQILDEEENVVVIKDNDGNPVETLEWVSGEEPKYIEGLPTGMNYILRETISPDGYTIASDTKFSIDEKEVITSDGTTSTAEDGTTVLVVEDDLTTVQISKVDTESGAELEGAKIQIIDEEGKVVEEWTSTKEVHVVRGLVANKKYILREQVAPLGYTLTTDTTFSVDAHNVVTSTGPVNKDGVILVNDTMTEVEILKVDSKTGKGLAGAKLQVLDDNGAVCDEWKSTKNAHKIRGLYTGVKYTLHEVEAPKGYDKAKDITFTIDTAGKVSSDALDNGKIVMKDTPTPKKNKTGDEANGSLWALLLMMASGALGGTVWFKRKRRV